MITYLTTTHYTLILVVAKAAFVADAYKGCRADIRIADRAFSITLIA